MIVGDQARQLCLAVIGRNRGISVGVYNGAISGSEAYVMGREGHAAIGRLIWRDNRVSITGASARAAS